MQLVNIYAGEPYGTEMASRSLGNVLYPVIFPPNQYITVEEQESEDLPHRLMKLDLWRLPAHHLDRLATIEKTHEIESDSLSIFYDSVNHGYIIVSRKFYQEDLEQGVETDFYFLHEDNYVLRKIDSAGRMPVAGRGCDGPYLKSSVLGSAEINTGGCFVLPERFYTGDFTIRLSL